MTDRIGSEPLTGTCWFCHREVPWETLIAGYDTWDEQRLACNTCNDAIRWMNDHGFVFSRNAALSEPIALEALRALSDAATPGEWGAFGQPKGDPWLVINKGAGLSVMVTGIETAEPEHDARLIAAAVNYVRAALERDKVKNVET